jgi:Beta-ketoacyl synthase, N-terminal domain
VAFGIHGIGLIEPESGANTLAKIGDEGDPRARRLPRIDRMALVAAKQALGDTPREGLGLVVGTGWGGLAATVDFLEGLAVRGPPFGSPTAFHESVHHAPAGQISIQLGITGPSLTASARELSGEASLRSAWDLLESKRASRVLVVCADEVVPALNNAFAAFGSKYVPAEGAAAILLGPAGPPVSLKSVTLGAEPARMLQFSGKPPDELGLNPSGGLLQVAREARRLSTQSRGGAQTVLETRSLGGAWARVTLELL